ncbi:F-box/LRR-repeat protein At2g29910-like [Papaver somniferum]|uniref:F-box/LRR-repeat protein At2g29910-like n=1 Tax=Papaver somniferum TaxID=3469 RepID=UPI000E700709|nr:F-box/LRR-repeat protein At2g29910-like [Papaver somniferum]XP_026404718.1 F-box/LRR-repeat protein At2g29910-like [Papaver somniferum]
MDVVLEDRISDLNDPIIHHIFSFLPIKNVVATTVLSKRWNNLWISTPILNIHTCRKSDLSLTYDERTLRLLTGMRCEETCGLVIILNRMLIPSTSAVPSNMTTIKKFHLKYHAYCEFEGRLFSISWIYKWISNVVMRKVEEVTLSVGKGYILPTCLFTCETLTMLDIKMGGDLSSKIKKTGTFDFPQSFSLPRLKILHLMRMVFVDEDLSAQLFSNCPVLEELGLTHCYMVKKKVLCISVASLKRLFITNSRTYSCKLNIHCPNLQSLTHSGIPDDYVEMEHGFSSLVNADFNIAYELQRRKTRQCGLKNLIGGVSNVEFLTISGDTLKSLYLEHCLTELPSFHNLRRLEVNSKSNRANAWAFFDLLHSLPNLELLVSTPGFHPKPDHCDFQRIRAPECVLLKLKAVEFRSLFCQQVELNIIKFFLANSLVLETMTLVFCPTSRQGRKDRFMKTVQMFPRANTRNFVAFFFFPYFELASTT